MRLVDLADYTSNIVLAMPVYGNNGTILINKDFQIQQQTLKRLLQMGIKMVIVKDSPIGDFYHEGSIPYVKWIQTVYDIEKIYKYIESKKYVPMFHLTKIIKNILLDLKFAKITNLIPSTCVMEKLKLHGHSLNVTITSVLIGKKLGYTQDQLEILAIGTLLHDIGKQFTRENYEHPQAGFNFLRKNWDINLLSAYIAFQHHETLDAQGYPRQIGGGEVTEMAQICGLSDAFDDFYSTYHYPLDMIKKYLPETISTMYQSDIIDAFTRGFYLQKEYSITSIR